jgi:hypothetical protein
MLFAPRRDPEIWRNKHFARDIILRLSALRECPKLNLSVRKGTLTLT